MITLFDEDYQQTKRLKKSGAPLESPFKELADWIAAEYRVRVLNVIYDTVGPNDTPRLSVILETLEDAMRFQTSTSFNKVDQQRVHEQFGMIVSNNGDQRFNVDGLFVIFSRQFKLRTIMSKWKALAVVVEGESIQVGGNQMGTTHRAR